MSFLGVVFGVVSLEAGSFAGAFAGAFVADFAGDLVFAGDFAVVFDVCLALGPLVVLVPFFPGVFVLAIFGFFWCATSGV